jgi:hypothetical protein
LCAEIVEQLAGAIEAEIAELGGDEAAEADIAAAAITKASGPFLKGFSKKPPLRRVSLVACCPC